MEGDKHGGGQRGRDIEEGEKREGRGQTGTEREGDRRGVTEREERAGRGRPR